MIIWANNETAAALNYYSTTASLVRSSNSGPNIAAQFRPSSDHLTTAGLSKMRWTTGCPSYAHVHAMYLDRRLMRLFYLLLTLGDCQEAY